MSVMATRRSARLAGRATEAAEMPQSKGPKMVEAASADTAAHTERDVLFNCPMFVVICDDADEARSAEDKLKEELAACHYSTFTMADRAVTGSDELPERLFSRACRYTGGDQCHAIAQISIVVSIGGDDDSVKAVVRDLEAANKAGITVLDLNGCPDESPLYELAEDLPKAMFLAIHEHTNQEKHTVEYIYDTKIAVRDTLLRCTGMLPSVSVEDLSAHILILKIRRDWAASEDVNETFEARDEKTIGSSTNVCQAIFVSRDGAATMMTNWHKWACVNGSRSMLFSCDPVAPWRKLLHWFPHADSVRTYAEKGYAGERLKPIFLVLECKNYGSDLNIGLRMDFKCNTFKIWMRPMKRSQISADDCEAVLRLVAALWDSRPALWGGE